MPAAPNASIVSVYGSDASARATPKSACTAGNATTTAHMPTPPTVDSSSVTPRRIHAYADSTSPCGMRSLLARHRRNASVPGGLRHGERNGANATNGDVTVSRKEGRRRLSGRRCNSRGRRRPDHTPCANCTSDTEEPILLSVLLAEACARVGDALVLGRAAERLATLARRFVRVLAPILVRA